MARTVLKDMFVEELPSLFKQFSVSIVLTLIFAFFCSLPIFSLKVLAILLLFFMFDLVFYLGLIKGRLKELGL